MVVVFLMICSNNLFSQILKEDGNDLRIDTIVTSTLTKTQIFSNATNYVASNFKSSKDVVQQKDLDLGELFFRGFIREDYVQIIEGKVNKKGKKSPDTNLPTYTELHFLCKIYVKEGRFRIILEDLKRPFYPLMNMHDKIKISLPVEGSPTFQEDVITERLAINFVRSLVQDLNKRPENDF